MKDRKTFWIISIIIIILLIIFIVLGPIDSYLREDMPGGRSETFGFGKNKKIRSDEIVKFSLIRDDSFELEAEKISENKIHVTIRVCEYEYDDRKTDIADYESEDLSLLESLKDIVDENEIYKLNGHTVHVNGLPYGFGEYLRINYENGEEIFTSSNESTIFSLSLAEKFFEAFENHAKENGYFDEELFNYPNRDSNY